MTKDTFGQLYLQLLPGLYRLAQSILHHREDAMDAVQQAIEKAWKVSGRIRAGEEKAYISRIVINECRNIQRQRMRVTLRADLDGKDPERADNELYRAVSALPEKYRLPLYLHCAQGYTILETARITGKSFNTTASLIRRGRKLLQKAFEKEEY